MKASRIEVTSDDVEPEQEQDLKHDSPGPTQQPSIDLSEISDGSHDRLPLPTSSSHPPGNQQGVNPVFIGDLEGESGVLSQLELEQIDRRERTIDEIFPGMPEKDAVSYLGVSRFFYRLLGAMPLTTNDKCHPFLQPLRWILTPIVIALLGLSPWRLLSAGTATLHFVIGYIMAPFFVFLGYWLLMKRQILSYAIKDLLDLTKEVTTALAMDPSIAASRKITLEDMHRYIRNRLFVGVFAATAITLPFVIVDDSEEGGWFGDVSDSVWYRICVALAEMLVAFWFIGVWFTNTLMYRVYSQQVDTMLWFFYADFHQYFPAELPSVLNINQQVKLEPASRRNYIHKKKRWRLLIPMLKRLTEREFYGRIWCILTVSMVLIFFTMFGVYPSIREGLSSGDYFSLNSFLAIAIAACLASEAVLSVFQSYRHGQLLAAILRKIYGVDHNKAMRELFLEYEQAVPVAESTYELKRLETFGDVVSLTRHNSPPLSSIPAMTRSMSLRQDLLLETHSLVSVATTDKAVRSLMNIFRHLGRVCLHAAVLVLVAVAFCAFSLYVHFPACLNFNPILGAQFRNDDSECSSLQRFFLRFEYVIVPTIIITPFFYLVVCFLRGMQRETRLEKVVAALCVAAIAVRSVMVFGGFEDRHDSIVQFGFAILTSLYVAYASELSVDPASGVRRTASYLLMAMTILASGIVYLYLYILTPAYLEGSEDFTILIVFLIVPVFSLASREAFFAVNFQLSHQPYVDQHYVTMPYMAINVFIQLWLRLFLFNLENASAQLFAIVAFGGFEIAGRGTSSLRHFLLQRVIRRKTWPQALRAAERYRKCKFREDTLFGGMVSEMFAIILAYLATVTVSETRREAASYNFINLSGIFVLQLVVESIVNVISMKLELAYQEREYVHRWNTRRFDYLRFQIPAALYATCVLRTVLLVVPQIR